MAEEMKNLCAMIPVDLHAKVRAQQEASGKNLGQYGGGTDSTAMLVGLWRRKIPVDLILFSDPGGEPPHTYWYLQVMDRWLQSPGMPPIPRVW